MRGRAGDTEVFERLFMLSPDLMCTLDASGKFEQTNPSFLELGYGSADLQDQPFMDFAHPDDRQRVSALLENARASSSPQSFRLRFRARAGDFRDLAWSFATRDGRSFAVARDETHSRQSHEKVQDLNRFLDAIVENIPNMIFVKEAERLAFVRFNRAGEELLGLQRTALLGKTDFDLFPPQEAVFFQEKDRETLNGKVLVEILEEPIATAHGERWLHTKKVPIVDERGTPKYLLGISEDITELKKTREQLVRSREETQSLNRELEAFSYSVAHDLRAPLRSMDGFSQAILEDYGDQLDDNGRKYLRYIREAAQEMAQLIDDILALSRVSRSEVSREPTDLSQLARQTLARLERAEPARQLDLQIEQPLVTNADPRLVGILLDNLLGNAWKFTQKRDLARIELGRLQANPDTFFVRDDGAGFDMNYADKLFGAFQRLHSSRDFEGTGIGLATVQRIVHKHGGRIWAEAAVDRGATFYFTLNGAALT